MSKDYKKFIDIDGYSVPIIININSKGFYVRTEDINMLPVGVIADSEPKAVSNLKKTFSLIRDTAFFKLLKQFNLKTL